MVELKLPTLTHLFGSPSQKTDITAVLKAIDEVDTNFILDEFPELRQNDSSFQALDTLNTFLLDSLFTNETPSEISTPSKSLTTEKLLEKQKPNLPEKKEEQLILLNTAIQFKNKKALLTFFKAIKNVKQSQNSIRILHYGDSQIEGDRMTDYLRLKLQAQFGGEGPGLVSFMPISRSVINRIDASKEWERYGAYTSRDKRVKHSNFGILASFCRFESSSKNATNSIAISSASLGITTTPLGGGNSLNFKRIKLFYGGAKSRTWTEFYEGPVLMKADSLEAGGNFRVKEYKIVSGGNKHRFVFKGLDSPDFYALSLEGNGGVLVDNIALRGSSGTFFQHLNLDQLKTFYEYLNVKLIILQFGGNALPSILDEKMAVNYGNYLRYQIKLIKKAAPDASFLYIGPSDMDIKVGTDYVTYPMLEKLRDEIKQAAFDSGCAYYDLYECMGGKNSMAAWVEQNLAASDYTHFSPQGARKMAKMLYAALMNEYSNYLKTVNP